MRGKPDPPDRSFPRAPAGGRKSGEGDVRNFKDCGLCGLYMWHDLPFRCGEKRVIVKQLDNSGRRQIVKLLVDTPYPPLIDHIGVSLWRAAQDWQRAFDQRMLAQGYAVFGEAASRVLAYVGPNGVKQADLAPRMGVTKQAAQQFLDRLEALDMVERLPDPNDARGRIVQLSEAGKQMMVHANAVKQAIEAQYRTVLGEVKFAVLQAALNALAARKPD